MATETPPTPGSTAPSPVHDTGTDGYLDALDAVAGDAVRLYCAMHDARVAPGPLRQQALADLHHRVRTMAWRLNQALGALDDGHEEQQR